MTEAQRLLDLGIPIEVLQEIRDHFLADPSAGLIPPIKALRAVTLPYGTPGTAYDPTTVRSYFSLVSAKNSVEQMRRELLDPFPTGTSAPQMFLVYGVESTHTADRTQYFAGNKLFMDEAGALAYMEELLLEKHEGYHDGETFEVVSFKLFDRFEK